MKKFLVGFYALLFLSVVAGTSLAVPFKVTGSALDVQWSPGDGLVGYTPYPVSNPIDLGAGRPTVPVFREISFPWAWGESAADLKIDLTVPPFKHPVTDLVPPKLKGKKDKKARGPRTIAEPGTLFLMGGGLLGLALVSRKKFKK